MSLSTNQPVKADPPPLNERQYRLWENILENRVGVRVTQGQDYICAQIAKRMGEAGWADADNYFREVLETLPGIREWGILLDRLLVKETRFFRHHPSHDYVRTRIAELVALGSGVNPKPSFNIWSAGCATGEEAYSLAIDAAEGFALAGQVDNYYVVATDISAGAIASAREGVYSLGILDSSLSHLQGKYFSTLEEGRLKIVSPMRRRVAFSVANLLEKQTRYNNYMDLIYCQNVLVYFKQWRRREIVHFFQACLKPGGCLIVGPGELTDWVPENMDRLNIPDVQVYQKRC